MKKASAVLLPVFATTLLLIGCSNTQQPKVSLFESPDAKAILVKDALKPPQKHQMPAGCITNDAKSIELGRILFNDYSNKGHKFKQFADGKEFGNCVACHNIEKGAGYGNVGPDLTAYRKNFVDSKARNHEWIFEKIADPRIDNPKTQMTINKTNGLLSDREICDIMSYLLSDK